MDKYSCAFIAFQTYADEHFLMWVIDEFNKTGMFKPELKIIYEGIIKNYKGDWVFNYKGKGENFFFIVIQMLIDQMKNFEHIHNILWCTKYHVEFIIERKYKCNMRYGYDLMAYDPEKELFDKLNEHSLDKEISLLNYTNQHNSDLDNFIEILKERMRKHKCDLMSAWRMKDDKHLKKAIDGIRKHNEIMPYIFPSDLH